MYKLKPVFRFPLDIQTTCSMYKLKDLHEKAVGAVVKSSSEKDLNDLVQLTDQEIEVLLKKQNEVLNTLEQLELRLSKLDIKHSNTQDSVISSSDTSTPCHVNEKKIETENNKSIANVIQNDITIFADPEDPPFAVLALPILWPLISWDISYHVHSSITKDLKTLKTIAPFKNVYCNDRKNRVKIFVIWKQIKPSPKVVLSPSPTDVLIGEVPLLRLFNQHLASETLVAVNQTNSDKVLDLINEITHAENDRSLELYNLISDSNTKLDLKNIALWSLLYKKNNSPPNVKKWVEQLTKIIIS